MIALVFALNTALARSDLDPALQVRLLGSIAAGRLVIVCGAGLSMDAPSSLPSAAAVARRCYDAYRDRIDGTIPVALRDNLEGLANHVLQTNQFREVFIDTIVPWPVFVAPPNACHEAVADLLTTGAASACLSANYDMLIEQAAWAFGSDIRTAFTGEEADQISVTGQPLIKFHGSANERRDLTVWTRAQFEASAELGARRASNEAWIQRTLPGKDLLFVGFWSDWDYLNTALAAAFAGVRPRSIIVVDPGTDVELQAKAPDLWAVSHAAGVTFHHERAYGAAFMAELQSAFSQSVIAQVLTAGVNALQQHDPQMIIEEAYTRPPTVSRSELYGWRRDLEGRTSREPAMAKIPAHTCAATGAAHVLLRAGGAVAEGVGYRLNGQVVRVVNGSSRFLSEVPDLFEDAPGVIEPTIVIVVGATDLGVPHHTIRDADPPSVVRGGGKARWLDLNAARQEMAF